MKIRILAMVSFEADTDDADCDLIPVDQAHELAVLKLPHGVDLEEIIEWSPIHEPETSNGR